MNLFMLYCVLNGYGDETVIVVPPVVVHAAAACPSCVKHAESSTSSRTVTRSERKRKHTLHGSSRRTMKSKHVEKHSEATSHGIGN